MTRRGINQEFDIFTDALEAMRQRPSDDDRLFENGVLGVGVLMGGGFPHAAAALALLIERARPGQTSPWLFERPEREEPPPPELASEDDPGAEHKITPDGG